MSRNFEFLCGGVLVAAAVAGNFILMGLPVIILNFGLIASYFIWASDVSDRVARRSRVTTLFGIGILVQCFHFLEEYQNGFQTEFPALFGARWSDESFIVFNLTWLFVFLLAVFGVYRNVRLAYLGAWFFAILAGIGNGILHPLISAARGSYFPGLITSFFLLIIGILLVRELTGQENPNPDTG